MIISDLSFSSKIDNLKDEILKLKEQGKKKDEQIMSQILLMNGSLARISSAVQNNSKLLESILSVDRRVRALAMPFPKLPSPFMGLLPIKSLEDLQTFENLLSTENADSIKYREELVSEVFLFFIFSNKRS